MGYLRNSCSQKFNSYDRHYKGNSNHRGQKKDHELIERHVGAVADEQERAECFWFVLDELVL